MSYEILRNVMQDCRLKGERRMLLMAMAHYADDDGNCWPSQAKLASDTALSERGVQKMMDGLISGEEIVVTKQGGGRGNPTHYRLDKYIGKGEPNIPPLSHKGRTQYSPNETTVKGEPKPQRANKEAIKDERLQGKLRRNTESQLEHNTADVVFPDELDTPDFKAAWAEWLEYRKQRKLKPWDYTELGRKKQFSRIGKWGVSRAIAAIDLSIGMGWQGIFEGRESAAPSVSSSFPRMSPTAGLEEEDYKMV